MDGRTHGVHAEPITFGAKLAGWAFELERASDRVERALAGISVGELAGGVGIYGGGAPGVGRTRRGQGKSMGGEPGRWSAPPALTSDSCPSRRRRRSFPATGMPSFSP